MGKNKQMVFIQSEKTTSGATVVQITYKRKGKAAKIIKTAFPQLILSPKNTH
jgi:hypothetical protein